MHRTLVFPIKCESRHFSFDDPQITEIEGKIRIWNIGVNEELLYDAFDYPDLIPELISLVEKVENQGKNRINQTKKWVKKWGVLKREKIENDVYGQSLSEFWESAKQFYIFWRMYKEVANRDQKTLTMGYEILEEMGDLIHFSDDPFLNKQWNAVNIIRSVIEFHIKNGHMIASQIKIESSKDEDQFKISPSYYFHNLVDSLYMQFFMALTENKKVCPICDRPFAPERKDKKYCSDTCRHTAKSQRYRARKKSMI